MTTRFINWSPIAIAALLVVISYACTSKPSGNPAPPLIQAVQSTPDSTNNNPRSLMVFVDKTQSASDAALREFVSTLKAGITAISDNLREIVVVNAGSDGKGAWNAPSQKFALPPKPGERLAKELAEAEETARKNCRGRLNCEQREINAVQGEIRKRAAAVEQAYQLQRDQVIENVVLAILQPPEKEPPCTNLTEMAERIGHATASHIVWLTDGDHTCKVPLSIQPLHNRVLLALLPLTDEANGNFSKRLAILQQTFTHAEIKPVAALSDEAIIELLKREDAIQAKKEWR